ncbi:hypothetical protein DXG01_001623 [Tephrocybe rancida]|nr:hypothetical protein DXG01_001623 [Tephrocybe rancida]
MIGPNVIQAIIDKSGSNWMGFPFLFALCACASLVIWFCVDVTKGRNDAVSWAEEIRARGEHTEWDDGTTKTDSRLSALSFALSRTSTRSSTEYDTTPGSSTSTVAGPGALTGKVVKALGVVTLKGFGRLVMARHWASVAHAFPHTDEQAPRIRHVDAIYADLLEFSR